MIYHRGQPLWDPEEEKKAVAWAELGAAKQEAAIAKRIATTEHWGTCQGCNFKIKALGAEWPTSCPECGYGRKL